MFEHTIFYAIWAHSNRRDFLDSLQIQSESGRQTERDRNESQAEVRTPTEKKKRERSLWQTTK